MDSPDLFDLKRKKKRQPRPRSPHAKRIQDIMLHVYFPLYMKERGGEKPDIGPRDWGLLRVMVDTHGPDLVEARMRDFFNTTDRWVREEAGFSIGVFKSQWQKLATVAQARTQTSGGGMPQQRCLHQPECANPIAHSRRLVNEMKRQGAEPSTSSASCPTASKPSDPF